MNAMRMSVLCALLMTSTVDRGAQAHEFWLQPKQFWSESTPAMPLSLRVGHGDHSARSNIPARRITRFEVMGPNDGNVDLRSKLHPGAHTNLHLDAPGAYVVVLATDNQARSDLPAERFNEYARAEGLTPALVARERAGLTHTEGSERYSRQAKSLLQVGASQQPSHVTEAVGLRLEIVPEVDPYAQPRAAQLPVRVIFEDEPLAGALVKLSSPTNDAIPMVSRVTNDHGRAVFEMPSQGEWLLHVTWTKALPSADEADFDTVFASLTFGLPGPARPFTASDLVTLGKIGAVAVSPDGRWLAWDQRQTDLAASETRSRVWVLDLEQPGAPQPLFPDDDYNVHHPRFSADGQWIYFLSDVSGTDQLWRTPASETAAEQVSDFNVSIAGYSPSPTGEKVAIWTDVSTACNELPCTLPQPVESCCGSGRGFEDAYVQRSDTWRRQQTRSTIYVPHRQEWMTPELRCRVFVMSVHGGKASSAMGPWLGDAQQVAWSLDGNTLFFTLREARREERFSLNLDIIESRLGEMTSSNLTAFNRGVDALPVTSPDGRWLAYVSAGSLQLRDLANGVVKSIDHWVAQVRSIAWAPDSRSLLVTARVGMDEPLFQISLDAKKVTRLTTEGRVANVIPLVQGGAVFTVDTMMQPADVYRLSEKGELKRLTAINADRLRDIDLPQLERFDAGWLVAPEPHRAPLPTVLLIHDESGPANSWSSHWNPLLFSAPGYAVLGINSGNSSKLAIEDLRRGLAAAADRFPALDPDNVCIAGNGAYGGYLAYRIAGEWSRQPRCLIANGGVVDATRMTYETDEPWMQDWQALSNPLHHVSAWRTPLLILHGERNFRVPYTQSLVAFTAAQQRNVPSRLVVFPDEGLQLRAPKNTIQWYGEVFNWLDRWLLQRH